MKTFKKLIAVILTVLTLMSVCVFSASAASVSAPAFELKVVSQSGKNATLELVLVSGGFNAMDITFKTSANIASVKSLYTTDAFNSYIKELKKAGEQIGESSSAKTKKLSLASTGLIKKNIAIYEINLTKTSSKDLLVNDIVANVTECIIDNTSVAKKVTVKNIFGKIELDKHDLKIDYKDSATLKATTSYKDGLTWSSSNTKVATVDANGKITTKGNGNAVITASSADGSVSDSCNVKVSYKWWQWIIVIVLFGWIWY